MISPLRWTVAAATALLICACSGGSRSSDTRSRDPHSADARLREIYTREWNWRKAELAVDADSDESRPIPDHLPRVNPAAQAERTRYWQAVLTDLEAIAPGELSAPERVNYAVYRPQIEALLAGQRFKDYEMPANSDSAFWSDFTYTARRPFRRREDYGNWLKQLRAIPRYFHEQMDEMRSGLARGFTPPQVTLKGRDQSIAAVVNAKPEDTEFYVPFAELRGLPAQEQTLLRAEAVQVIREAVQPAYAELLRFMRAEYVPHTRTTIAAYDLPEGAAYYRSKIREFTTLDLTPETIHELGVREVADLHTQMVAAMRATGFRGDFPAFLSYLRTDPRFYARTPEELLMRAAWIAKQFDAKAAQYFGYLPRARFAIRPVPAAMAPFYTAGRGGPNVYLLNTYDLPSRPLYNLTALTLHESAPGHTFQGAIALEHTQQPEFRRATYISAYGEGWALYCERLGLEMGLYPTAYDRFGMLGYQIWRAVRLVLDTGVHAKGWTRAQAIAYLREYSALPEREIETEVDRYITWPGQALSYYLGERAILQARADAAKALGERFNIRAFHDMVLELGSVPLPVLENRTREFISAGGQGPYPDME